MILRNTHNPDPTRRAPAARSAFTMIELLVVIAIIALLITLVAWVADAAIYAQRARNTEQIMNNVMLAIDTFSTEDPLRVTYNRKDRATFGSLPPYQLKNAGVGTVQTSVARAIEFNPPRPGGGTSAGNLFSERLARDLGCNQPGDITNWVRLHAEINGDNPQNDEQDDTADIHALYAYLRAFTPQAASAIPAAALKPMHNMERDYMSLKGSNLPPSDPGSDWVDVLGIHDAWGVPLDYTMYAKLDYGPMVDPANQSLEIPAFRVLERKPVLRSLGIDREVYDVIVDSEPDSTRRRFDPETWIWSEPLPKPFFGGRLSSSLASDGTFGFTGVPHNGWVRAVGFGESYGYLPDQDRVAP